MKTMISADKKECKCRTHAYGVLDSDRPPHRLTAMAKYFFPLVPGGCQLHQSPAPCTGIHGTSRVGRRSSVTAFFTSPCPFFCCSPEPLVTGIEHCLDPLNGDIMAVGLAEPAMDEKSLDQDRDNWHHNKCKVYYDSPSS
ncbi:hypothetical protein FVEG_15082 [Fusarium verticillioides 7600]|nr:hypothetical protein FVEG_15082 [Fusarium verticillioides 7600]XP_018746065.1 hypothetical protein FVEG_15082 [Fusarium verticillioides 7600]EWG39873.1 hypothetical protein FVEG_15082 [Fusarium verticillioides 7600]EWG39874.1 hypothetical protein FVEG_15082 [Fusarium verticillioides 7600]